ncbi:ATP-grasp domain-containing protein [Rhizobium laguerreae]|uniref:ATP-grasp domain-containing protein n=1 Tax=Rhizobium laguerreae TaxID=1076926 RepID=UPI001C8FD869|nr:ATP-grasp domain-containing protein [Rhizobium laguerreae]
MALADVLIVGISNIPNAGEYEAVKAVFPAASAVLDRWRDNWNRIAERNPATANVLPKPASDQLHETEIECNRRRHKEFSEVIDGTYVGRDGMRRLLHGDYYARHLRGRQRNFLHHYVDDAFSFLSLDSAQPGMAILWTPHDLMLLYTGKDDEGFLTFCSLTPTERAAISSMIKTGHEDDGRYWQWEPMLSGMRRESREADDHIDAAEILLDMAKRGHRRAFVKAIRSKCGTWTVDLTGVETASDALRNLIRDGFDSSDSFRYGLVVQEHLPTTREQRFFVTNGRIVASVCSDRNLNGTNLRAGRYFDERVAVIQRPEVAGGEFERGQTANEVNRPLAAAFAREARRIVREMRAEGRTHYVLDMGLTERGVVAIEINSFFRSGPYCLDRRRVAEAHKRSLTEEQLAVAAKNVDVVIARRSSGLRPDPYEYHRNVARRPAEIAVSDEEFDFEMPANTPSSEPGVKPSDDIHAVADRSANEPPGSEAIGPGSVLKSSGSPVRDNVHKRMARTNASLRATIEAMHSDPMYFAPRERRVENASDHRVVEAVEASQLAAAEPVASRTAPPRRPSFPSGRRSVRSVADEEG